MRALRFDRVGDVDAIHLAEVPTPGPARGAWLGPSVSALVAGFESP
jgi:hypothetical protein